MSEDWQVLLDAGEDVPAFLASLDAVLAASKSNFNVLQGGLAKSRIGGGEAALAARAVFLSRCLTVLLEAKGRGEPMVAHDKNIRHLLAMSLPSLPEDATREQLDAGEGLFMSCCCEEHARLAVKVASSFRLSWAQLSEPRRVEAFLAELLASGKNMYNPAVSLMLQFPELLDTVQPRVILSEMVAAGDAKTAERWAESLDRELQICLVDECVAQGNLKAGVLCVRSLGLKDAFPEIEDEYKRHRLDKLADKGVWSVAAQLTDNDPVLQAQLVTRMAAAGEAAMAVEYAAMWELPDGAAAVDSEAVAEQLAARRDKYLQLPEGALEDGTVMWVDSEESLRAAREALAGASVVGIDTEWKPQGTAKAALLQLATEDTVVLVDLLACCELPELGSTIGATFKDPDALIVGLEVTGDLKVLASSYPDVLEFRTVEGVVDLKALWPQYCQANGLASAVKGSKRHPVGLSRIAEAVVGKPLDKSMQVSDWEARPLSPMQMKYAALDAWVAPQIVARMQGPVGPLQREDFEQAAISWKAGRPSRATRKRRAAAAALCAQQAQGAPRGRDDGDEGGDGDGDVADGDADVADGDADGASRARSDGGAGADVDGGDDEDDDDVDGGSNGNGATEENVSAAVSEASRAGSGSHLQASSGDTLACARLGPSGCHVIAAPALPQRWTLGSGPAPGAMARADAARRLRPAGGSGCDVAAPTRLTLAEFAASLLQELQDRTDRSRYCLSRAVRGGAQRFAELQSMAVRPAPQCGAATWRLSRARSARVARCALRV